MAAGSSERPPTKMLQNAAQKAACGSTTKGCGDDWNPETQQTVTEQYMHAPLPNEVCGPIVSASSLAEINISFVAKLNKASLQLAPQRATRVGLSASSEEQEYERSVQNTCSTPAGAQASARASPRSIATRGTCTT